MSTIFQNAAVFDGTQMLPAGTEVHISGDQIVAVGVGLERSSETELRDLTGYSLMPGMIDCHVHVMLDGLNPLTQLSDPFSLPYYVAADVLRRTLRIGITTVRDAGGADLGVKRALEQGLLEGPEMLVAITMLSQTGGHADGTTPCGVPNHLLPAHPGRPYPVVDGPAEMRKRVRELQRAGADVIKICTSGGVSSPNDDPRHPQFGLDELESCVGEATAGETPVMAHAQGKQGILNAVTAGVRSVEHGVFADEECFDALKASGVWLVPTLTAPVALKRMIQGGVPISDEVARKSDEALVAHAAMMRGAVKAGVKIAMGTDSGVFPHGENLEELVLMREAGMTPEEVLQAATRSAAELLKLADRGRIATGLRADLVVVAGDALDFDGFAQRITSVYQRGRLVR